MKLPIYMDHHATTPVDSRVLDAMLPYFSDIFGNAASIDHEYGNQALIAVENARKTISSSLNATPEEIIFTSGATESDNLAILGVAEQYQEKGKHIITCVTEHKAVLETCKYLVNKGWKITYLPVDQYGLIDPNDVKKAITKETVLISIMTANNEIGVIAPIKEIGAIAHEENVLFHTDAAQAIGYLPIDVEEMNIDLLSISGHKIYGPKGIGALYVRKRHPRVKLAEQIHGGGHERGIRSGTLNVPGIIGLSKAIEICHSELDNDYKKVYNLRNKMWEVLQNNIKGVEINGSLINRLPNNLNFSISRIESRSLIVLLKYDVAISTGSACTTVNVSPSHVVSALGYGTDRAFSSIRIGLGRNNTVEEIYWSAKKIEEGVKRIRSIL